MVVSVHIKGSYYMTRRQVFKTKIGLFEKTLKSNEE